MTELNIYLSHHYLNEAQLSSVAAISLDELNVLIEGQLVPAPAYVVSDHGTVRSFVFGEMAAPGARPGRYFHPAQVHWIAVAREAMASGGALHDVQAHLKAQFTARYAAALANLDLTTWRLHDSFDGHGTPIPDGLLARTDSAWTHFLNGTFSLCVANPVSEAQIACKEVLQEKLGYQSENGGKMGFTHQEASELAALIDAYAAAAMPFSPVEYALSSRKRLVEDLRARLGKPDMDRRPSKVHYAISVSDTIENEVEQVILGGLNAYNDSITGSNDRQALTVVVRDPESKQVLGGAIGRTSLGLLFLDLLYLPAALRGSGLGSQILETFEEEGRRRGCVSAVLYTISFQAPDFYARRGWRTFGEIVCNPAGTSRIFMSKHL
jgi:GNAT superfamily N-acetyltransferase